jgi:hypothetical protein
MSRPNEHWLARNELIRRGVEAGIDERVLELLLYAFEAGLLRDYAAIFEDFGEFGPAGSLKNWAKGIRPIGWLKLLPDDGAGRAE